MSRTRKKCIRDFKKAIVYFVRDHKKKLGKSFAQSQPPEYLDKALSDRNWVHTGKYFPLSYDYELVHEFDCRPYNGELKAYVYTDPKELNIENVIVQIE
jgi:hypothetical protein